MAEMEDLVQSSSPLEQHILSSSSHPARNVGGWKAIRYILGNESFEKLASMSLIANMTVYLKTNTTWEGMVAVTLTAAVPQLTPPKCEGESHCLRPEKWQLGFLFVSLGFLSIGAGGIRPCNIAFGADQFDTRTAKGRANLESFFNWWYFCFTIALLVTLTGVIYIQTDVSWVIGFAIPTACLCFSISIFLIGHHTYICKKPQGSIFADMLKAKKLTGKDKRLTMPQRIKIGIVMSILCMLVAAIVEKRRRESALKHGSFTSPVTIALLLPQFVLSGLTEAFAAVAIMEFYTTQMPESMRTVAGAVFFLSLSIASYVSSLLINIIRHVTGKNRKLPWLGGHDLNKNRLDYYYYIIAGLGAVNFIYFNFFASRYAVNSSHGNEKREVELEESSCCHSRNLPRDETEDEETGLETHGRPTVTV
ncbi:hypothetical protein GH714_041332 [Hevea brasiliensis]|uniref:Major facilitator superfamily (MFS) profile domain-containing protein n=1 Tax=Hevea brasiliensis TaxID=3981 RepID=A0A6A6MZH4_HEVBR|nr:hypothetical protein GH714_041332 [Hevea brasiliensis]